MSATVPYIDLGQMVPGLSVAAAAAALGTSLCVNLLLDIGIIEYGLASQFIILGNIVQTN